MENQILLQDTFKRLAVVQDENYIQLSKDNFRNLGFLHGEDKPFFAEVGIYRIPAEKNLNPVKPWMLEVLIESEEIKRAKSII